MVLWDGGMGTALIRRGLARGEAPETWNLDRPEQVRGVHRAFFEAGSDLVQTNTFGANRARLSALGLEDRLRDINRAAAAIALSVCPDGKVVVGDLGPTGETNRDLEAERMEEVFAEQARILQEAGVHLIHGETYAGKPEALAALRGARTGSSLPVIISITLRREGETFRTLAGDDPMEVYESLVQEGADAVGTNCLLEGPEMVEAVRAYRSRISIPFVAQPAVQGGDARRFEESVQGLLEAGANGIGGCCGVDPAAISSGRGRVCRR